MIEFDNLTSSSYVNEKLKLFYSKNGYLPKYFAPYNCAEVGDICITISCNSGQSGGDW